jgi:hypothetical protein
VVVGVVMFFSGDFDNVTITEGKLFLNFKKNYTNQFSVSRITESIVSFLFSDQPPKCFYLLLEKGLSG